MDRANTYFDRTRRRILAWLALASLTACGDAHQQPVPTPSAVPPVAPAHPDFSGVWMAILVETPEGGVAGPLYSGEGSQQFIDWLARFSKVPEPGAACVGSGMPGMMFTLASYPIEIAQTGSRLLMVAELETQVRRIFIDGRDIPTDAFATNTGYSLGMWEGDTLVVETTLLEEWAMHPWPRTANTRIVERLSLTTADRTGTQRSGFFTEVAPPLNEDVLVVDLTIEDPLYADGSQRRIAYYQRMPDDATSEYACSQGLWYDELDKYRIEE